MQDKTYAPEILDVITLLHQDRYIIPLYQRAYAWTKTEIDQLLSDIWGQYMQDPSGEYYIGSLVVSKNENSTFEIIDGQQRHTTLILINAVVNYLFCEFPYSSQANNLCFEGRTASQDLINEYSKNFIVAFSAEDRPDKLASLSSGIKDILRYFESLIRAYSKKDVENFIKYIYKQVCIIRIPLPKGTNLNQYFEIMNNRGEQLEPHQILKAKLLSTLQHKSEQTRQTFSDAWDACSQMNRYIQPCFKSEVRESVFGTDLLNIPKTYLKDELAEENNQHTTEKDTLKNILEQPYRFVAVEGKNSDPSTETRFRSIINFPNFLLHVLTLHLGDDNVSLDDKKLLDEFGCGHHSKRGLPDAIEFINNLLYYRTCFDRYLVKREEAATGSGWKILQFNKAESNYINVFTDPQEIIMIQSMLQVSFTSNNFKNWLRPVLALFKNNPTKEKAVFYSELQTITQNIFTEINKNLQNGTSTPIFLFNYLDFRLWQIYKALTEPSIDKKYVSDKVLSQIEQNTGVFKNFRFRQNNSVEHIAPQRPDTDVKHHVENLDHFGNLCLISRNSNSKYSNANFYGKQDYFLEDLRNNRVESLKQALIFRNDKWKDEEILEHGSDMVNILFKEKIMSTLDELIQYLKTKHPQEMVDLNVTNFATNSVERKPQPKYLFRGERTIDWKTSPTTFSRNLLGKPILEHVNYLLTGQSIHIPLTYQCHSLFHFLREDLFNIGICNEEPYSAQIDVELAGIFQHYGFDTCLLDLTGDINIAASFASTGSPGDVGQIMMLESKKIEDKYFELTAQPGNRAIRQNAYGLLGTPNLDVKSPDFSDEFEPKWFKFILTQNDKLKYTNNEMLSVTGDRVVSSIKEWWIEVGSKDLKASDEAKTYIEMKIALLK